MHTRTSTVSDTVAHIHTQNHAQTNEQTCTNDARMHTRSIRTLIVRRPFGYKNMRGFTHIHSHIPGFTFTTYNIHTRAHAYTETWVYTQTVLSVNSYAPSMSSVSDAMEQ